MDNKKIKELADAERKEYLKNWRAKNKEHIAAYSKEWRANNKDKIKANMERYWERRALKRLQEAGDRNGKNDEHDQRNV